MGLGSFTVMSLADARIRAAECRRMLHDGIDPLESKRATRAKAALALATVLTFSDAAAAYIKAHRAGWRSVVHAKQWERTLQQYAEPVFGNLSVDAIDTPLVLKVIEPLWERAPETASRLRGRVELILDWAKVRGHREGMENPARWRGHLDKLLPARSKVKRGPAPRRPALRRAWRARGRAAKGRFGCGIRASISDPDSGAVSRSPRRAVERNRPGRTCLGCSWREDEVRSPASRSVVRSCHRGDQAHVAPSTGRLSVSGPSIRRFVTSRAGHCAAPNGPQHHDLRYAQLFPRLGSRAHELPGRGSRDGVGAHRWQQSRECLPEDRHVRP